MFVYVHFEFRVSAPSTLDNSARWQILVGQNLATLTESPDSSSICTETPVGESGNHHFRCTKMIVGKAVVLKIVDGNLTLSGCEIEVTGIPEGHNFYHFLEGI